MTLPRRAGGRKTWANEAKSLADDMALCNWLERRWHDHGFAFGARGWAYVCEGEGIIDKGQFKAFETWLARVRKQGLLDPDVVADDDARKADHVEIVDDTDPETYAGDVRRRAAVWLDLYTPVSVWDGLETYIEVLVEKADLKTLFDPVCVRYGVILTNGKGSSDINLRRRMLQRFRDQHAAGKRLALLYCGDHDPAGLRISDVLKTNLLDCADIRDVDWNPEPIEVIRFGLDAHQIDDLGLPWIEGLITGSGRNLADPRHPDFRLDYVQNYIADQWPEKGRGQRAGGTSD
jgi:hypothetical protein